MPINKLKHPKRNYYMGWNSTAQNKEISYAALGLHTYLLSLPDDWEIRRTALQRANAKIGKVNTLIAELVEHGLLYHAQTRDENGKLSNSIYEVYTRAKDNPYFTDLQLVEIQVTTNPLQQSKEVKKEKTKDSFAEKNAKDAAPSTAISDATKKGDDVPPEIDWEAKILAVLTDDWQYAAALEHLLWIPEDTFFSRGFHDHPAAVAIYALEAERKVEYDAGATSEKWRLYPDGQSMKKGADVPLSRRHRNKVEMSATSKDHERVDWEAKILAVLTDDWMGALSLEYKLGVQEYIFDPLVFKYDDASIALYSLEGQRKVEYQAMPGGQRRRWRLHPDGQPAPKSERALLSLAISRCLKVTNGALRDMTHMLRGTAKKGVYGEEAVDFKDNPVSADELERFAEYWDNLYPDIHKPRKPKTVSSEIGVYRLHVAEQSSVPEIDFTVHDEVVEGSMEARNAEHMRLFMESEDGSG